MDGSPSSGCYTILSYTQAFTTSQLFNVHCFSVLRRWLAHAYPTHGNRTTEGGQGTYDYGLFMTYSTLRSHGHHRLPANLKSSIVSYCVRVLEQSRLIPIPSGGEELYNNHHYPTPNLWLTTSSASLLESPFHAYRLAVIEVVHLLSDICDLEPGVVCHV